MLKQRDIDLLKTALGINRALSMSYYLREKTPDLSSISYSPKNSTKPS